MNGRAKLVCWLFFAIAVTPALWADMAITNFRDSELLPYSLPLLRGTLRDKAATKVLLTNLSSGRDTRIIEGLAHDGSFLVFADLEIGENELRIDAGSESVEINLVFGPQSNNHVVRAIYFVMNDGNTDYQTPLKDDPQNYQDKIGLAMRLMQSFTADSMAAAGHGHSTFNVEQDLGSGKVMVRRIVGKHGPGFYYRDDYKTDDLYLEAAELIEQQLLPRADAIDLAIIGFTRGPGSPGTKSYFPALRDRFPPLYAHTALGGGRLAIFGSQHLWAWPSRIGDIQKAFLNDSTLFPEQMGDYDGKTIMGAYSIALGASMHELGHAFGRPHEGDFDLSIMQAGFDRIRRHYVFHDLALESPHLFPPHEIASWSRESTDAFADDHPYFLPYAGGPAQFAPLQGRQESSGQSGGLVAVYRGDWDSLPDFASLKEDGVHRIISIDGKNPLGDTDYYALRYRTLLHAPMEGIYAFYLRSDDGSRIFLGGRMVAELDGLHGIGPYVRGEVRLSAGYHELVAEFFDKNGGEDIQILWEGPGISLSPLGPDDLFYLFLTERERSFGILERPRKAVKPGALGMGLIMKEYSGAWDSLPDFSGLRPSSSVNVDSTALSADFSGRDDFALTFNGYIRVPVTGDYRFFLSSDDGSRIFMGSDVIVDNDGLHGPWDEKSGYAWLEAGYHPFTLEFFERGGGEEIHVHVEGPGLTKMPLPREWLFH